MLMGSKLLAPCAVLLCAVGSGPAGTEALDLYPHTNDPFVNPLQQQAWAKPPPALSVSGAGHDPPAPPVRAILRSDVLGT
jgi:hypothetical protein